MEQRGRNGEENAVMKIGNQERERCREGQDARARREIRNQIMAERLVLRHRIARKKKNIYVEKSSEVACGLVPALKLRGKMNTDRERRTGGRREKNKNKCQASIKSES